MTIDTLVISGGAHYGGLKALGFLRQLFGNNIISMKEIRNMYGVSVGSLISAVYSTLVDNKEIVDYVINRPWTFLVEVSPNMIFSVIDKKGMFNKTLIYEIMKPLLSAKNLSCDITLKEFYEYNNIHLRIYTHDINSNKTIELSYKSYPDYKLIDCIYYSCTIPLVFEPTVLDNACYIDPAAHVNYPIEFALKDGIPNENIIGIKCLFTEEADNLKVTNNTPVMDYMFIIFKQIVFDTKAYEQIDNEVKVYMKPFGFMDFIDVFRDKEARIRLIDEGSLIGDSFINNYRLQAES